jgi:hypothetical protein
MEIGVVCQATDLLQTNFLWVWADGLCKDTKFDWYFTRENNR